MPDAVALHFKGSGPLFFELIGNRPSKRVVTEPHTNKVALGGRLVTVDKGIPAMEDSEVVYIMHIAGLGLNLHLSCLCDGFYRIEGLLLVG